MGHYQHSGSSFHKLLTQHHSLPFVVNYLSIYVFGLISFPQLQNGTRTLESNLKSTLWIVRISVNREIKRWGAAQSSLFKMLFVWKIKLNYFQMKLHQVKIWPPVNVDRIYGSIHLAWEGDIGARAKSSIKFFQNIWNQPWFLLRQFFLSYKNLYLLYLIFVVECVTFIHMQEASICIWNWLNYSDSKAHKSIALQVSNLI